jgi:protoheme IX farnesyltransferase
MNIGALHRLTKPGVTYGNLITTVAGYLFAAGGDIDWSVFVMLTIGTWGVIASACVINNYLDRDIDAAMTRTKNRPLLTGEVTPRQALILGAVLGIGGIALLSVFTNYWVVGAGVLGWVVYVWLYGALGKRKSVHGTLVGSVSGAAPILAGYVAARGTVDLGAVLVFAVLFFWQMPEFYSIAIYRRNEYAAAGVPVITVIKGVRAAIVQIFGYTTAFVVSVMLLPVFGYAGATYAVVMGASCLYWLFLAAKGLAASKPEAWSRRMFKFSMIVLLVFSLMISIDAYLP